MKKLIALLCVFAVAASLYAQDTSKAVTTPAVELLSDSAKNKSATPINQPVSNPGSFSLPDTGITDLGVAVAPSNIRFRTRPGSTETKYITVTNDTHKPEKFKISVADYDMSDKGAIIQIPVGQSFEYGLSKWVSISPSFIELKAGEAKKVAVTVTIPDQENAYRSAWCIVMIDQATEKKAITPPKDDKGNIVMGVIPVFGFGVYVFQNPPNVKLNKVEIAKFNFTYSEKNRYVSILARNTGDGLGFCKAYVEINNLNTGYKEKLFLKQFTIFPGKERTMDFDLPGNLAKGKYIATAVLDFGSDEEIEAAELEFKVE